MSSVPKKADKLNLSRSLRYWHFVKWIYQATVGFPQHVFFIASLTCCRPSNQVADDLRRHGARMTSLYFQWDGQQISNAQWSLRFIYSHLRFINTMRPGQSCRHILEDRFTCIFLDENCDIWIKMSLKYVPRNLISNKPAFVQIIAWRRTGAKPLSEPMMA